VRNRILWLDPVPDGEPVMSGRLIIDAEIVERLTTFTPPSPALVGRSYRENCQL